jgi:hypothetical protein
MTPFVPPHKKLDANVATPAPANAGQNLDDKG